MKHDLPKRTALNIRIRTDIRGLIDEAARTVGKNRTDFIIEAARRAAEEALLDRTLLTASPRAYAKFRARLDNPGRPSSRLLKTAQSGSTGERD